MNKLVAKTSFVAGVIASLYLFVSLVGLFPALTATHSHMHMRDCPYMIGEQSLCSMDLFGRVAEWKVFSTAIVPLYAWLALMATITFAIPWRFFTPSVALIAPAAFRTSPPSVPLYQTLFSSGILHPKAP